MSRREARRALAALILAATAPMALAGPARADDASLMGEPVAQVYIGPEPEPFTASETLTIDPPVAPVPMLVERGTVRVDGKRRPAIRCDHSVFLARTMAPVSDRVARTFRVGR